MAENKPSVFVSERHANPFENAALVKREKWGWAVALAVLAVIAFAVVLILQYGNFSKLAIA